MFYFVLVEKRAHLSREWKHSIDHIFEKIVNLSPSVCDLQVFLVRMSSQHPTLVCFAGKPIENAVNILNWMEVPMSCNNLLDDLSI